MSVQEQELDEAFWMITVNMNGLYLHIAAERDKYKARYEYLESLCCIGLHSEKYDWCELRGRATVIVEKNCDTVCEAVDFVLGGNGV